MEYFSSPAICYVVKDVGKSQLYDIHATKADAVVRIEVKGATSNGSEIILTRNEAELHIKDHPTNALAIVRNINLHGPTIPPQRRWWRAFFFIFPGLSSANA
ncbi:hypothetical protein A5645_11070 [Mycobacterium asiaticum]|nr:hypothetical protein A5645_11070 [Mycobacterium asiaticum]